MTATNNKVTSDLFGRFAAMLRVTEIMTPDEWAQEFRVYGETTGVPGPRDPHLSPSMVPFGRAASSGLYTRACAVTAAQMGKTDTQLDIMGQRLDQRPTPILYVGPSVEFNRDQFEPRVKQLIDESETLSEKLVRGRKEKKTRKIIGGVTLRLASAGSSTALKSDPAGLAIVDEYDEMIANIKGQGDPLGLVEARGETYADFLTVIASTPSKGVIETEICPVNGLEFFAVGDSIEIESPIWRVFQEGTRYHWAWDCPSCGETFIPMRKHLKWDDGATPIQARRSAYVLCPNNGCRIEDDNHLHDEHRDTIKGKMNAAGFMIAPGQTIADAKADINRPDNSTYSQWSSGLASPFVTWGKRAERVVKAEMSGEEDKKQTATNANFGELYSPGVVGDMPQWKEFLKDNTKGHAPGNIHKGMLRLVLGADVQQDGLYYVIRGFGSKGTSWLVDNGYLIGATALDDVWEQLANIFMSPIQGVYIEKVVIDAGYRPDKPEAGSFHRVYDFCRQYSHICTPARGKSTMGGKPYAISTIEVKKDGSRKKFSIGVAMLDTDFFKSMVQLRIKTPTDKSGAFLLHNEADEEYARQVLSEVRIVSPGKMKPEWKALRRDNHYFDCEALAAAGGYALNVHKIPEGVERAWGEGDPEETAEQDSAEKTSRAIDEEKAASNAEDVRADIRKRFGSMGRSRPR